MEIGCGDNPDDDEDHHQDVVGDGIDEVETGQKAQRFAAPWPGNAEGQRGRVDAGDAIDPARPVAEHGALSEVAEDAGDDLPEPESHDRQVIAAQPQRRRPQDSAEAGRDEHPDEQEQPEGEVDLMVQRAPEQLAGRKHSVGVGADGEERRVAEIEESREADHDIQAAVFRVAENT